MEAEEHSATLTSPEAPSSAETTPQSFGQKTSAELRPTIQKETNGDTQAPGKENNQSEQKRESRYERTKKQRAAFLQREAALKQREEQLARVERERAQAQQKKDEPDCTLAELKQYRQAWENEGKFDLVEKADLEIQRREELEKQDQQSQAFQTEWHQAEAELAENDPE